MALIRCPVGCGIPLLTYSAIGAAKTIAINLLYSTITVPTTPVGDDTQSTKFLSHVVSDFTWLHREEISHPRLVHWISARRLMCLSYSG